MINTAEETLVTLKDAAKDFSGVAIPYNTIQKYAYRGVKGIKLETVFINQRYTSKEAIQRFIARRQGTEQTEEKPKVKRMTKEQVQQTLRRHGIIK
jgi:hypothetical protein